MKTLFVSSYSGASVRALSGALLSLTDSWEAIPSLPIRLEEGERRAAFLRADESASIPLENVSRDVRRHYESIRSRAETLGDSPIHLLVACLLMEKLRAQKTVFSPIALGPGAIEPSLLAILDGASVIPSERSVTPLFASFAREYADSFGSIPPLRSIKTACGVDAIGGKAAATLGEADDERPRMIELTCNVDDMTPEALGFAMDVFFAEGALEVYTVPLTMKKSRPGILITVTCRADDREKMLHLFFKHTTTLGVRECFSQRHALSRSIKNVSTSYGTVRKKISTGYGVTREKYEYDDLSRIARENGIALEEARTHVREEDI